MLISGTLIHGRYQVLQQIGIGGMGAVYKALDTRLGHMVAVKHMLVSPAPERVEAFRREAQLLARLRHPALPVVTDHFAEPYGHFLVMQYIEGQDLSSLLLSGAGAFDVGLVLSWADRLLEALSYLHDQRPPVIHRDIKPQNLKLADGGQIMLLDFGLAKSAPSSLAPEMSGVSVFGYTLQYAPLEQIHGAGTDVRSDLYALAATLYHLLAGAPPPNAPARASAVLAGLDEPLLPLPAHNPQVPEAVDQALRRAMALPAEARTRSAAELRSELRRALPSGLDAEQARALGSALASAMPAEPARAGPPPIRSEPVLGLAGVGGVQALASTSEIDSGEQPAVQSRLRAGLVAYAVPLLLALLLLGGFVIPTNNRQRMITGGVLTYLGLTGLLVLYENMRGRRQAGALGSHPDAVLAVAYAPSGRVVASAAGDGSISLWQPGNRELRATCAGHHRPVRQLCFTPDSRTLISASDDRTVRLWQARDGQPLYTLSGHAAPVYQVALSADGELLASASEDGTARLWRVRDAAMLHTLRGHAGPVYGVALARAGGLVGTASDDGLARIWRARDGELLHVLSGHTDGVCAVAFSPDGRTLATCSRDATVRLWRVRDGQPLRILRGHTLSVGGLAFHPGGELLASRSEDATVRLWRVRDGELLHTLGEHERAVSAIAFAHGGDMLASASWDGTVQLWRVRDGQPQRRLEGHAARILALDTHPDGRMLATGGLDRAVRVWPL